MPPVSNVIPIMAVSSMKQMVIEVIATFADQREWAGVSIRSTIIMTGTSQERYHGIKKKPTFPGI